jgi:hypothetical protein
MKNNKNYLKINKFNKFNKFNKVNKFNNNDTLKSLNIKIIHFYSHKILKIFNIMKKDNNFSL